MRFIASSNNFSAQAGGWRSPFSQWARVPKGISNRLDSSACVRPAASRDNYAGDYVTAESEAEAIELYKDFLIEQIRNNNLNAEIVDDEIVVTDDEENEVERFINFEIED